MKRLFTFGCSYTRYCWPTWADLLSLEFEYYENWGISGIGCNGIAERISECHARHNFTPDDTIIVQWSTHLRNDFYHVRNGLERLEGWMTSGSIFSKTNREIYDRWWYETFFYEPAYIMHCLNKIHLTQHFLDSLNVKWFMTGIGDWEKLSSDIPQKDMGESILLNPVNDLIWDRYPEMSFYKTHIWDNRSSKWIKGIEPSLINCKDIRWIFKEKKTILEDSHPNPRAHSYWLNQYLRPKLGLTVLPESQNIWLEELDKIKNNVDTVEKFMDQIRNQKENIFEKNFFDPRYTKFGF